MKKENEWYYYYRDASNVPKVTICLIKEEEEVARGVSVCSEQDIVEKKQGRKQARGEALKALGTKKSGSKVLRDRAIEMLKSVGLDLEYRSVYMPDLTDYERQLVGV